ncbi:GIY-YIG nuclease family protein [Lysobacter sp. cf310]|uniref:GIY-YIG nuclease family protein n=1 Tax=Lysobacter sp. cf310 TaxID=1761790 RepID=UPI0008EDF4BE|nr:GIY-YIG nuclease family protein [Lysobacter sp. cf310]SFK79747.1 T5orf172 domain-containing protein [Lysobacter sp. cf310]
MAFLSSGDPDVTHSASEGRCYLYVLPCAYEDLLKLGFSRSPLRRLGELQTRYYETFDLERAFLVETETVRDARDLELTLRHALREHQAPAPLLIRREAAGHTEWYRGAYALLRAQADALGGRGYRLHAPLRDWLAQALLAHSDALYAWGASVLDALGGDPEQLQTPALAGLRTQVLDALDAYPALGLDLDGRLPEALYAWHRARRG